MSSPMHPFYEAHRPAMEAAMRQSVEFAGERIRALPEIADATAVQLEILEEFQTVLAQMPYVGGTPNRMSDFFMRLLGFIAISRVLRRHGVDLMQIGDIEREAYRAQLLTAPEEGRLEAGRQFLSLENQALIREQAIKSDSLKHQQAFPADFVYDFVTPGPTDDFEFGINYRSCGFCKFAAQHGDKELLPNICGLDFDAYAVRGIRLVRTQTLAGGASHCDFRFSRLPGATGE